MSQDPDRFFAQLGYRVTVERDSSGVFWADLTSLQNPDFVVRKYGRGESSQSARERAAERWREEQIG